MMALLKLANKKIILIVNCSEVLFEMTYSFFSYYYET